MDFLEYELTADVLCMGEVVKANLIKPCARVIRYTQITGALRHHFGIGELRACGYLDDGRSDVNRMDYLTYSPRDRAVGLSKVPLQVEYLSNVKGRIFVPATPSAYALPGTFELRMGAMLSKGFGLCRLRKCAISRNPAPCRGLLRTRLPLEEQSTFGIRTVSLARYGYLLEPESAGSARFVLSLFEGSEVIAPEFLVAR